MATVPGTPNVVPMMPEWAKPTQADFLQAAAIMHGQGKFQVAAAFGPDWKQNWTWQGNKLVPRTSGAQKPMAPPPEPLQIDPTTAKPRQVRIEPIETRET